MTIKIGNTKLKITFLFTALLTTMLLFDKQGMFVFMMLSNILHELAHAAAMRVCKTEISAIRFMPFGIEIEKSHDAHTRVQQFFISFAGVALNFALFAIAFSAYRAYPSEKLLYFASVNLCIGALNSLPVRNLDGGDILSLFLEKALGRERADSALFWISITFIFLLAVLAFFVFFRSNYNFSLFILCFHLLFLMIFRRKN